MTGPIACTRAIAPLVPRHEHRVVDSVADLGFVYSIFERQQHTALFPIITRWLRTSIIEIGALKRVSASAYRLLRTNKERRAATDSSRVEPAHARRIVVAANQWFAS
ncbi:MAG TPA: hypothetical protein VIZ30_02545 [Pseudomonadales bacterium]